MSSAPRTWRACSRSATASRCCRATAPDTTTRNGARRSRSAGCAQGYFAKHESLNTRDVINYLLFDCDNSSSVNSCLSAARRNGRAQRTVAHARHVGEPQQRLDRVLGNIKPIGHDRQRAAARCSTGSRSRSALYRGALLNTILRNDTFYFSQLGTFLERADNTARILDVKYYVLLPEHRDGRRRRRQRAVGRDPALGLGAPQLPLGLQGELQALAHRRISDPQSAMPRSLRSCYDEMAEALDRLASLYGDRVACHATAQETRRLLAEGDIERDLPVRAARVPRGFHRRATTGWAARSAEAYHFND